MKELGAEPPSPVPERTSVVAPGVDETMDGEREVTTGTTWTVQPPPIEHEAETLPEVRATGMASPGVPIEALGVQTRLVSESGVPRVQATPPTVMTAEEGSNRVPPRVRDPDASESMEDGEMEEMEAGP